jgi:hypothetical protein
MPKKNSRSVRRKNRRSLALSGISKKKHRPRQRKPLVSFAPFQPQPTQSINQGELCETTI